MNFNEQVLELCKKIPRGKITTYKILAEALNTKAYRAVGNALKKNKHPDIIPCFKVVKTNGEIGGFATGTKHKIKLLQEEGIELKNNKIVDFEKRLYRF